VGKNTLRRLLADIVESSFDAIFSRSLDGTIISWNLAAQRIFGYPSKEIVGRNGARLLPPDRPDEQAQLIERVRKGERIDHFETVRLRKDGRRVAVSMTVSPIRDGRKRIIGASTIARDITRPRELEAELLTISEQERQRIGRDLHDGLGQQLSGMVLLSKTLAHSLRRQENPEAGTARILTEQLVRTVDQTRALAHGLVPLVNSPNGLMLALQKLARETEIMFAVRCAFHCHEPVLIHEYNVSLHLYRIVQEAIANAVRHGKASRIRITLDRSGERVWLSVLDNGTGLPRKEAIGDGIGMHLMRHRASLLDGTLQFERARKGGTRVVCSIHLQNDS
jgi:PAS domain S-box-containing protein